MRVLEEIPHPELKITVFEWQERFIVKIEGGPMEQTFKFGKDSVRGLDEIKKMLDEEFLQSCYSRFDNMFQSLSSAIKKL